MARHGGFSRQALRWCVSAAVALGTAAACAAPADRPAHWTPDAVSTSDYESSPSFSPDGQRLLYLSADPAFSRWRLLETRCTPGGWSTPAPPAFAMAAPVMEADPAFTPDGAGAYFISTRHDPKHEDFDIYFVARDGDGWGTPERLPRPVNSDASELLPRVDGAGRLYFGSSRAGGQGQGDLYVAERAPSGDWTVRNLGPPVSTAANEYEAEVSQDGRTLVVVADRGDRSHLYLYRLEAAGWRETGRIAARDDVFQVGPLLSPRGERLLFAQADDARSGEWFLVDLVPGSTEAWPPAC
ncbi:MAG: PD40 domain-containing protein [Lysobacter sp.]|nr:PD40 domain-containing protein [Lysobacter sp.]